ncbi:redoxin domain-containing protein [Isosphaeraceae bacterium EP7]
MRSVLAILSLLTLAAPAVFAHDPVPLAIGSKAPDFRLPGVDDKDHALADYASAKVLVVYFTCNHCPTAQAYQTRIAKLHDDYKARGVAVVAISPNDPKALTLDELAYSDLGDTFEEMKIRARDAHFSYPYLYDGETQETAKAYGVLATPHVFIFDEGRTLRYQGRFDDGEFKAPTTHEAIDAVEALLAGKPVKVATTRVPGCSTKWSDKRANVAKVNARWDAEPVELGQIDEVSVAELVKNDTQKYRLINLWATWCGPCVEELDDLVSMNRMYRGPKFEMITISLDEPEKRDEALGVLREHHASTRNFLIHAENRDKFADALDKDWPGPVPYTMLVAPGGRVVYRKSGAFDSLELKRAIVKALGRTY